MSHETATGPPALESIEAEEALLGAALLDYHVFVAFDVEAADFSDARWRAVWRAGQELAQEGTQADHITLPEDVIRVAGGAAELMGLVNRCPSHVRAGDYAGVVKGKADQRSWIKVADWLARAAYKDDGTRHELLGTAVARATELLAEGGGASPSGWAIHTLADACAPRDPLEHVVSGLLPVPSLSVVYGPPGCFKSLLLADLALCVASGLPWLDGLPTDEHPATGRPTILLPTLWMDFDNGRRRTDERLEALARARGLDPEATPFFYTCLPSPWLDGSDAASVEALTLRCKTLNAGLVVVDNLGTVSGSADENSAQMVQVLANFRRLAEATDAAVVLVHHQRKSTGFNTRAGDTLRGHSSIEAALDLALLVQREERSDMVTVKSTKSRGVDVPPFGALFTYDHKAGTDELAAARFWGVAVADDSPAARAKEAVREALADSSERLTKGQLVKAAKAIQPDVGTNRYRDLVDLMAARGDLTIASGARNAQLYSLQED